MDIFAFIQTTDPTKVKVAERERREDKPRLLETTVGRTVPLLPVASNRGESELDASVDKLFDERNSGTQVEQGDSAGGGQDINIQPVTETNGTVVEDAIPLQPQRQRKRKPLFLMLNAEVRGEPIPTLPFVTSSISAMPEREDEGHTDSAEVDSFARPSVPIITAATTVTSTVDPAVVVKEKVVRPSIFSVDSTSAGGTDPA
ncbi:hypothetical protein Tco_0118930, partial [Tanacetum coccineum]